VVLSVQQLDPDSRHQRVSQSFEQLTILLKLR